MLLLSLPDVHRVDYELCFATMAVASRDPGRLDVILADEEG